MVSLILIALVAFGTASATMESDMSEVIPIQLLKEVMEIDSGSGPNVTLLDRINDLIDSRSDKTSDKLKEEMTQLLWMIYGLVVHQGIIPETKNPVWAITEAAFTILDDYVARNEHELPPADECPYSYDLVGGHMCLSMDVRITGLSWGQARAYCQIFKAGDLATYKDVNSFNEAVRYIKFYDRANANSYLAGALDRTDQNDWRYITKKVVPWNNPIWGYKDADDGLYPNGCDDGEIYAIHSKDHGYRFICGDQDDVRDTVPICMYYPGKGHVKGGLSGDQLFIDGSYSAINTALDFLFVFEDEERPHPGEHSRF